MKPMSSESSGSEWERDAHAGDVIMPSNSVFIANKNSGRELGRMHEGGAYRKGMHSGRVTHG